MLCGRDASFLPEQPKYARGEALGLAQGKVEDTPEHQHQLDCRVEYRAWFTVVPATEQGRVRPVRGSGHRTAPGQPRSRPILDPMVGLQDAVTARGLVLERYAQDRNGSAAAGSPASAPGGSLHRPTAPDLSSVNRPPLLKSAAPCAIDSRLGLWRSHSRRASSYRQDRTARAGTPENPYR